MHAMKRYDVQLRLAMTISFLLLLMAPTHPIRAEANDPVPQPYPSPYDMVDAVNQFRASYGMAGLQVNDLLMISAQKHSEYQAFLGTWTHDGPGGSNETDRAIAEGYGGGESVICDEAVAMASTDKGADYIIYTLWNDYEHKDLVLLNSRYVDIGTGVAEKDNLVYYTVDVCVTSGESLNTPVPNPTTSGDMINTPLSPTYAPPDQEQVPIATVTPLDDGTIIHIVQPGQTMWDIAIAYDMLIVDLATMNGISPSNPVVYVNQEILVRYAHTPTLSPTVTETPRPPTRTMRPTKTATSTRVTRTPTRSPTITMTPTESILTSVNNINQRTIGIALIIVSALGLILAVGTGLTKGRK